MEPLDISGPAIYRITNLETNEFYIGATSHIEKRTKEHLNALVNEKHPNKKLQESFNKTNLLGLSVVPMEDPHIAFLVEKQLIKDNKTNEKCLNIRGAYEPGMLNRKMTEEQKEKISIRMKKEFETGIRKPPMLGKHFSDASRKKLSNSKKELYQSGYENPFKNKTHSDEFKEYKSDLTKQQWSDPEFRARVSSCNKERWNDPGYKEKMTEISKERWNDPGYKEKMKVILKKASNTPENIEKRLAMQTDRMKDPHYRRLASEGAKKQWENPEYRESKCKKTTINGKEYNSLTEALENENIPKTTYYRNLKKGKCDAG